MYTIATLEDTVISTLNALKASLGVQTLKTYPGNLDPMVELKKRNESLPAIYLGWEGNQRTFHGMRQHINSAFCLFAVDINLANEESARRGDTNPGTYAIMEGIRGLLLNQRLGLIIAPIMLLNERIVNNVDGLSIGIARYSTFQWI